MSNRFDLEQLYFQAKESYYSGEPVLTDDEFDRLEQNLISLGSDAPYIVGADDRKAKYSHPSPMLSLSKFQAAINGTPPTEQAVEWMKKFGSTSFEITPKYDGNAANAIYIDGKLTQVLSRGNGTKGRDITDKVRHNLPETVDFQGILEVRGEIVIQVSTFNEKYAQFKNPRNYVAGVLNRDENPASVIADLDFIPLEIRQHINEETYYIEPRLNGFKHKPRIFYCSPESETFIAAYTDMVDYRKICQYQLDGFVIKAHEGLRSSWGENGHHPNWAVAIKFPPKEAITKILDIQWNWGKSGEVTPVAIMESVDLDGSTVSRATMFNYGYVKNLLAFPGATVAIAKSGDIIPQITRVVTPGNPEDFSYPTHCLCGAHTKINGIHLHCSSNDCSLVRRHMFAQGVRCLELDGIGGAMIGILWESGFRSAVEILNPNKFNQETLIQTGFFKAGKTLDNLLKQVARVTELKPAGILMMLGIEGMGHTTATQVGNYLSGTEHSFSGLEKSVISGFEPDGDKRTLYESAVAEISPYIKIVMPEKVSAASIGFEMTGSPKSANFKTKEDFIAHAKSKGYHHAGMKNAKVLFVDDLNSSSSKMTAAKSKGIQIMLYSEL
jgi:DNA ligase (NAD+)